MKLTKSHQPPKGKGKAKVAFKSYAMGSIHGSLRRIDLYRERYDIRAQAIYDAVATMLDHEIPVILTANDQDFQRFGEIQIRNPFGLRPPKLFVTAFVFHDHARH